MSGLSAENNWRVRPEEYPGLDPEPVVIVELDGEEATRRLGAWIGKQLGAGAFMGLVGDLGAGKTTLMQGVVSAVDEDGCWQATSPTYSLVQVYETTPPIFHIDLYRLKGWAELESIGYWDYLDGGRGVTCVEWLDRIAGAWPGHGLIVELVRDGERRKVRIWTDKTWNQRVEALDASSLQQ